MNLIKDQQERQVSEFKFKLQNLREAELKAKTEW
jgi:hypothetical protein